MLAVGKAEDQIAFASRGLWVDERQHSPEERMGRVSDRDLMDKAIEMRGILPCLARRKPPAILGRRGCS